MYENENYQDYSINAGQPEPKAPEAEYRQYSAYPVNAPFGDRMGQDARMSQNVPPRKERRGGGFFRKALVSVSLGLFFGLFAGLGFYAIQQGVGFLDDQSGRGRRLEESVVDTLVPAEDTARDARSENEGQSVVSVNTNSVTVVESDISHMVEEVMPSMVSIVNTAKEEIYFFGQTYTQDTPYSGSGIIVGETDDELLIVTNYHVVEDATKLEVTFIDESTAEAQIKGTDPEMDLAVISVPWKALDISTQNAVSVATLGNSDTLKLGEPVIAIGNALGYGQSVTSGIISALNREVEMDGDTFIYIQTDAAINGGNSGGALLNVNGEVIGINSAKIGGSMVEGMGYAIPISEASPIVTELMARETRMKVDEEDIGYIGISLQEVTSQIAQTYNMPVGIYVVSTEEGGAAERAGIVPGDIITRMDGQKISSYEELQKLLEYYAAGDTTTLTIMRQENGQYVEYQKEITLGRRPSGRENK